MALGSPDTKASESSGVQAEFCAVVGLGKHETFWTIYIGYKKPTFSHLTASFKYFVLSYYNESYFRCNSILPSAVQICTPWSLCSWWEDKKIITGALHLVISQMRQKEQGLLHMKWKTSYYSTTLERNKNQVEHELDFTAVFFTFLSKNGD